MDGTEKGMSVKSGGDRDSVHGGLTLSSIGRKPGVEVEGNEKWNGEG